MANWCKVCVVLAAFIGAQAPAARAASDEPSRAVEGMFAAVASSVRTQASSTPCVPSEFVELEDCLDGENVDPVEPPPLVTLPADTVACFVMGLEATWVAPAVEALRAGASAGLLRGPPHQAALRDRFGRSV